jgi:hypothetical protein
MTDPSMADSLGLTFTAAAAAAAEGAAAVGAEGAEGAAEGAEGAGQEAELVPGGSELAVTAGNVQQYVDALLDHKLMAGCEQQVGRRGSGGQHTPRMCPGGRLVVC